MAFLHLAVVFLFSLYMLCSDRCFVHLPSSFASAEQVLAQALVSKLAAQETILCSEKKRVSISLKYEMKKVPLVQRTWDESMLLSLSKQFFSAF